MARMRPVSFEDRLTLVEHLDELRTRIVVCLLAFFAALGLCFWQNNILLEIANEPLPRDLVPLTFGVAEPFMTTLTVCAYAALLLSLPVIIYQAYAFILPALSDVERRTVLPLLLLAPFLFVGGVVFSYFFIVPFAAQFLLSFNVDQFTVEVRARDYYSFLGISLMAIGLLFQLPIGLLAVVRLGIVTPDDLAANRRYAVLAIAVVSMLVTSPDPVTMLLAMAPLYVLFEASIVLARLFRPRGDRLPTEESEAPPDSATGRPG